MSQATSTPRVSPEIKALIEANLPLVGHLVRELLARVPAHVRREYLFSAGSEALVAAATKFDPARGAPFGAFATLRIRGALLDELRGLDWASRSVRGKARRLEGARDEFVARHGRIPTDAELAETMETDAREVAAIREDVRRSTVLSLQGGPGDEQDGGFETVLPAREPSPEQVLVQRERIGYLHDAITALPERLRVVIEAYYFQERPMAKLAEDLGVTESRISQLRAEATALLRDGLNAHLDPRRLASTDRPGGCAARRRASYYAAIATQSTLRSRLAHTTPTGIPLDLSA